MPSLRIATERHGETLCAPMNEPHEARKQRT